MPSDRESLAEKPVRGASSKLHRSFAPLKTEQTGTLRFRVLVRLHRAPGFVRGMADIFQCTVDALGLAGDAELASVPDDLVGKQNPFLARDDAHQVLLDLLGISVCREFEAARNAVNMGVDDHAFRDFEP